MHHHLLTGTAWSSSLDRCWRSQVVHSRSTCPVNPTVVALSRARGAGAPRRNMRRSRGRSCVAWRWHGCERASSYRMCMNHMSSCQLGLVSDGSTTYRHVLYRLCTCDRWEMDPESPAADDEAYGGTSASCLVCHARRPRSPVLLPPCARFGVLHGWLPMRPPASSLLLPSGHAVHLRELHTSAVRPGAD